jgi:hypothetical protein
VLQGAQELSEPMAAHCRKKDGLAKTLVKMKVEF